MLTFPNPPQPGFCTPVFGFIQPTRYRNHYINLITNTFRQ